MKDITTIHLTSEQVLGGTRAIVTKVSESKKYVDGHYTDEIACYKVEAVAVADKSFDKVVVKVTEKPEFNQKLIETSSTPLYVTFNGFEARIYKNFKSNTYEITCKAQSVQLVKSKA